MQLISALTSIYTKMGDNNKNEKNHVSEELAELIERKLSENIALLKLINKIELNKIGENKSVKVKTDQYHK